MCAFRRHKMKNNNMKKTLLNLLTIVMVAMVAWGTVSCSKDDGGGEKTYTFNITKTSVEIGGEGETLNIPVNGNDYWTATSNRSWCTVPPSKADNNGKLDITVSANMSAEARNATVTVVGLHTKQSVAIVVSQAAGMTIGREDFEEDEDLNNH